LSTRVDVESGIYCGIKIELGVDSFNYDRQGLLNEGGVYWIEIRSRRGRPDVAIRTTMERVGCDKRVHRRIKIEIWILYRKLDRRTKKTSFFHSIGRGNARVEIKIRIVWR
jgi:hypothetical protein